MTVISRMLLPLATVLSGLTLFTVAAQAQGRAGGRATAPVVVVERGRVCASGHQRARGCNDRDDWCRDRNHDQRCDRAELARRARLERQRREAARRDRVIVVPGRVARPNWLGRIIIRAGIGLP